MILEREVVHYSELTDTQQKGIGLGLHDWFLDVEKRNGNWKLQLLDLNLGEVLSSRITIKDFEELKNGKKTKILRDLIKQRWENPDQICDWMILEIQKRDYQWREDIEELEETEQTREKRKISGLSDEGYFEAIADEYFEPKFLIYNKGTFKVADSVSVNSYIYIPKELNQIPYSPYRCDDDPLPNLEELYQMIYQEFDYHLDLETIWKNVLCTCVLLTYQQEKVQSVPYIFMYGDNESGKTTVLELLNEFCYRPMFGVTVPAADLYGYLEDADCILTILEDEIQGVEKEVDKIKIYKSGYKKGAVVPRTILLPHGRVIRYYNTFCFKAVAGERIPLIKGFAERFVQIPMIQGYPKKEWADNTLTDMERFRKIRNMLLKWRLQTRDEPLPNLELPFKGRVKEIWKPLLQVAYGLRVYQALFDHVDNQIKERVERSKNTLEGKIVKVVGSLYHGRPVPFKAIWETLQDELEGTVDSKKPHAMHTPDFDEVTKKVIGYRLREILKGERDTIRVEGEPTKVWLFDRENLLRVLRKYGYQELVTKLPMLPISEGVHVENQSSENFEIGFVSEKKRDLREQKSEKNTNIPLEISNIGNTVTAWLWRQVKPSEKCELCGSFPVEYEITMDDGSVLRRCPKCFNDMRTKFVKVAWKGEASGD